MVKLQCTDCGSLVWKIDISDAKDKKKKIVAIVCQNCGYGKSYIVLGEETRRK